MGEVYTNAQAYYLPGKSLHIDSMKHLNIHDVFDSTIDAPIALKTILESTTDSLAQEFAINASGIGPINIAKIRGSTRQEVVEKYRQINLWREDLKHKHDAHYFWMTSAFHSQRDAQSKILYSADRARYILREHRAIFNTASVIGNLRARIIESIAEELGFDLNSDTPVLAA